MEKIFGDGEKEEVCGPINLDSILFGIMIILYVCLLVNLVSRPMELTLLGFRDLIKMPFSKRNLISIIWFI